MFNNINSPFKQKGKKGSKSSKQFHITSPFKKGKGKRK